jgi:hypothetical protein
VTLDAQQRKRTGMFGNGATRRHKPVTIRPGESLFKLETDELTSHQVGSLRKGESIVQMDINDIDKCSTFNHLVLLSVEISY